MPKTLPIKLSKEWIVADKKKTPEQELPRRLRAGNIKLMEGMAAAKPPRYYVEDYAYLGYPLIRGKQIIVVADAGRVQYQDEKVIVPAPDSKVDEVFAALYEEVGAFVLEGVVIYPDANGDGHKSGAKAVKSDEENGDADKPVAAEMHLLRALYLKHDLRLLTETYRHMVAETLVKLADHPAVKLLKAYKMKDEKEVLADKLAIWVLREAPYRPGLDEKRQVMVYSAPF
jgi:hypothetical protein